MIFEDQKLIVEKTDKTKNSTYILSNLKRTQFVHQVQSSDNFCHVQQKRTNLKPSSSFFHPTQTSLLPEPRAISHLLGPVWVGTPSLAGTLCAETFNFYFMFALRRLKHKALLEWNGTHFAGHGFFSMHLPFMLVFVLLLCKSLM